MKKILLYNWVQFDDEEKRGGGVTVYIKNLIDHLLKDERNEIYFLSSGMAYDLKKTSMRIEATHNIYEGTGRCHSFEVVNSPVLSPSSAQFHDLEVYLNDQSLYQLIKKFIRSIDGLEVIHFNNLEGLSINVLNIKEDFPGLNIVFSLHNYFPFCPQVNLWWKEQMNCIDYKNGSECIDCVGWIDQSYEKQIRAFGYYYDHSDKKIPKNKYIFRLRTKRKIINILKTRKIKVQIPRHVIYPKTYTCFRNKNIELINKNVDHVLAVSERVREIAIKYGLEEKKVVTSYIGTKVAEHQKLPVKRKKDGEILNLVYMGYVRRDKGFFFLLDALKCMEETISKKIKITFATRMDDPFVLNELNGLKSKFAGIVRYDGYDHNSIAKILKGKDLGVIPVLWQDNLPQVAIEMASFGVPILTSDLGGAHELSGSGYFVFKHGDIDDFIEKVRYILENRDVIEEYWVKYKGLTTMEEHINEIKKFYFK